MSHTSYLLCALLCFAAACTERRPRSEKLQSFQVTVQSADLGTLEAPLPFVIRQARDFVIDIQAMDSQGNPVTDLDGPVTVSVVPGRIVGLTPNPPTLSGGATTGVQLSIKGSFGATHIWVEDATGTNPFALGTGNTIWFENPRVRDIQEPDGTNRDSSPLAGSVITVDRGDNYVVHVSNSGFFIVDKAETVFNSVYAFSFSRPEALRRGEKLLRFSGNISEFVGYTELGFPTWDVDRRCPTDADPGQICDEGEFCVESQCVGQQCGSVFCSDGSVCLNESCAPNTNIPLPVDITSDLISQTALMEQWEGGLVRFQNVIVSHEFKACDDPAVNPGANGNGTCEFCRNCTANRDRNGLCPEGGRCCDLGDLCYLPKGECANPCTGDRSEDNTCPEGAQCCEVGQACKTLTTAGIQYQMCEGCSTAQKVESLCDGECRTRTPASSGGICTNMCDFREFAQYRVGLTDELGQWTGRTVNLTTRDTVPNFRPDAPENRGKLLNSVTGTLREVYTTGPFWILEVRDECDIDGLEHVRTDCHLVR